MWNRRRKQTEIDEWGEDTGDVSPSPSWPLLRHSNSQGTCPSVGRQSEVTKHGSERVCAEPLLKGTFACSYVAGWELLPSTEPYPADKALPMQQQLCAEEAVLQDCDKHSRETLTLEQMPWPAPHFFPQKDVHDSLLPLPLAVPLSSPSFVRAFVWDTAFVKQCTNWSWQQLFCSAPTATVRVDLTTVTASIYQGSSCIQLWSSTATSGSSCKSSSHLTLHTAGWEVYNLSI